MKWRRSDNQEAGLLPRDYPEVVVDASAIDQGVVSRFLLEQSGYNHRTAYTQFLGHAVLVDHPIAFWHQQ